jgi:hypothetical protein
MTWPGPLVWLGLSATLATLTSLVLAWDAWETTQILARMDAAHRAAQAEAQTILDRMDARHRAAQEQAQALLDRMDRAAEQRAQALRALKDRLEGEEDDR